MVESINPVSANLRLAQLLGTDDLLAQAPSSVVGPAAVAPAAESGIKLTGNAFDDILAKSIEALNGVSQHETYANDLIGKYAIGEAELQDVMVAQAKMSVMVQLAVTTVNAAVNTFKEITQMQI